MLDLESKLGTKLSRLAPARTGEATSFSEEAGAESVKVGAANLELERGISAADLPRIELLKDLLEKQVDEAFCDLLF